jgi:hypothetical protein
MGLRDGVTAERSASTAGFCSPRETEKYEGPFVPSLYIPARVGSSVIPVTVVSEKSTTFTRSVS